MASYMAVASRFSVGTGLKEIEYQGCVVASPHAFFLVIDANSLLSIVGAILGGAIGGGIGIAAGAYAAARAGELLRGGKEALELDAAALPTAITNDPEWPDEAEGDRVIVIPRDAVTKLRFPWWGALGIDTGQDLFKIHAAFWSRGRVVRFLRNAGWQI